MSAAELPEITIRYAWDTGQPDGAVYNSPHEARLAADRWPGISNRFGKLNRLYVMPNGEIVHTELVAS